MIGRNRGRFLMSIFDSARNIRSYSLDNNFHAKQLDNACIDPEAYMQGEVKWISAQEYLKAQHRLFEFSRLVSYGDGRFVLTIHANLWYEFEAF